MTILPSRPVLFLPGTDDTNIYEPFDDLDYNNVPGNPTFGTDFRVVDEVLQLPNANPSAEVDTMFIPLKRRYGDCTGLLDIGVEAFCNSLSLLCGYYIKHRHQFFLHGIRIYLNGDIAGRQSVKRYHWRCIGQGEEGGDLGPYRTFLQDGADCEVVGLDRFPNDFTVKPTDRWSVLPYPTPHANVDLLIVPPAALWQGGLRALGDSLNQMRSLRATIQRLMQANPLHFAWGYRFLILVGRDARQSPIPGMPFECRLLAGGIEPGSPLPVSHYDDLGRYSMIPYKPDPSRGQEMGTQLKARAQKLGKIYVPSHWQRKLQRYQAAFPQDNRILTLVR